MVLSLGALQNWKKKKKKKKKIQQEEVEELDDRCWQELQERHEGAGVFWRWQNHVGNRHWRSQGGRPRRNLRRRYRYWLKHKISSASASSCWKISFLLKLSFSVFATVTSFTTQKEIQLLLLSQQNFSES